ncbi:MAG: hypothetical protein IKM97_00320 [Clostridia bacterium]|nr:hypothetical protein [Clostridia bacterium]
MDLKEAKRKQKIEKERKDKISSHNSRCQSIIKRLIDINNNTLNSFENLFSIITRNLLRFNTLQIPIKNPFDSDEMRKCINKIKINIDEIKRKIEGAKKNEDSSLDEVNLASNQLDKIDRKTMMALTYSSNLQEILKRYDEQSLKDIKKGIDYRIQEIIKRARIALLEQKKEEIKGKKISWFGRLRGEGKLQEAEINNLDMKIEFESTKPIVDKGKYSIHDSLADMLAFSKENLNGQYTQEMQGYIDIILMFFDVNEQRIESLSNEKLQVQQGELVSSEFRRESIRRKIKRLNEESSNLYNGICNNAYQKKFNFESFNISNSDIDTFLYELHRIEQLTSTEQMNRANIHEGSGRTDTFNIFAKI